MLVARLTMPYGYKGTSYVCIRKYDIIVCIVLRHDATVAPCKPLHITPIPLRLLGIRAQPLNLKTFSAVCSKRLGASYPERRNI